jgi:dTDP-4-amino-4,6-dideoxygalactose transaminase
VSGTVPHSRPTLGEAEVEAVARVIRSGQLAQGPETVAFETELAAAVGRRYGVAVSSGTTGLQVALLALGVGRGDEVLVPSFVCSALLHAVWAVGAAPVVVDVEEGTGNLDPGAARGRLGPRVRAVILPHLCGLPARVEEVESLGLPVIEDCAMAVGTTHRSRPVGSLGILSVCSFYATKMMATGEGGMVLTDDPGLARAARGQREYDGLPADRPRLNAKTTDLAAALGRVQLARLPGFVARRRELAARYRHLLRDLPLSLPPDDAEHAYHRFVVRTSEEVEPLLARLAALGVAARRPVARPLHAELGLADEAFPRAAAAWRQALSLPIYPSLTEAELEQVAAAVQAAV